MTPSPAPPRPARRRAAFTLVELLTVIGIIIILIAILLPTVGKVKIQANQAHTLQQINSIQAALEAYKTDQGAYPGALPNSAFDGSGLATAAGTSTGKITMTESAYLALWGGWEPTNPTGTATPGTYDFNNVGNGPMTFTVNLNRRARRPPYIDPSPGNLTPFKASGNDWAGNGITGSGDSNVPEFVDRFQDPRPILYMRANVGAPNAIPGYPSGATASNSQYNPDAWLAPYKRQFPLPRHPDFDPTTLATEYPAKTTATGLQIPAGEPSYFANASLVGSVRGQNAFILISAGADGVFGTKDDIFYP